MMVFFSTSALYAQDIHDIRRVVHDEVTAAVGNTFPIQLGYGALAVMTAAGGALGEAIRRLWRRIGEMDKAHAESLKKANEECRKEIDGLRADLNQAQSDRLAEVEKLLREQHTLQREVMETTQLTTQSLKANTEALNRLTVSLASRTSDNSGH